MKEELKQIIEHYGVIPQLKYFQSEVFELNEAIINHQFIESDYSFSAIVENKKHIAEEIADCLVMLKQFQYHYGIEIEEIVQVMKFKIERQLERIKNEVKNSRIRG